MLGGRRRVSVCAHREMRGRKKTSRKDREGEKRKRIDRASPGAARVLDGKRPKPLGKGHS